MSNPADRHLHLPVYLTIPRDNPVFKNKLKWSFLTSAESKKVACSRSRSRPLSSRLINLNSSSAPQFMFTLRAVERPSSKKQLSEIRANIMTLFSKWNSNSLPKLSQRRSKVKCSAISLMPLARGKTRTKILTVLTSSVCIYETGSIPSTFVSWNRNQQSPGLTSRTLRSHPKSKLKWIRPHIPICFLQVPRLQRTHVRVLWRSVTNSSRRVCHRWKRH